ncbi:uncharacterized protein LOC123534169 isoform X2 [Mercenaria mercenaria]|uniref:uncharacterized protein LOC123534169 isoform X2 n=1 Tax=Mercenaria mercenaria TaxID=6596 RepID=UPI00234FA710|nr:uncharacterized protein LOC123534169 isoform X2 [Mercenaria mercenaria]
MANRFTVVLVLVCVLFGTNVKCSEKKGVGMAPAQFMCDDFKALSNMKWWYDWAANGDKLRKRNNCTDFAQYLPLHVPMTWGNGSTFPNYIIQEVAEYLLGFNEPNHQAQSNLTAQQAFELWPEVITLATGKKLVSPAAAPCGKNCNGDAFEWFDEFFRLCNGNCKLDYLATHVYYCDADRVMNYLLELYNKYNLTIWVTEFACPGETDPAIVLAFMEAILPRLEAADYVFRYAWYISRLINTNMYVKPAVSLLEADSSTLTTLGKFYNNFGEPTTTTSTTTSTTTTTPTTNTPSSNSDRCMRNTCCRNKSSKRRR